MNQILGKYDFRSKQQYIYRTNTVKEIIGASAIITGAYDGFISLLEKEKGWKIQRNYRFTPFPDCRYINDEETRFDPEPDEYAGKVLYVGGGNLFMLWKDMETALTANRVLCRMLRETAYSLTPVCGLVPYTGDYEADLKALNADFEKQKGQMPVFMPRAVLPFTQVDRKTSLPIAKKQYDSDLSMESVLKQKCYEERVKGFSLSDEINFDNIVTEKGTESLLAVFYADGNNMGSRVRAEMAGIKDYPAAVSKIRAFSNRVQKAFVSMPAEAIRSMLKKEYRFIVAGGDEITLVCNAREALKAAKAYFAAIEAPDTACAGICVFHSHDPFATAYAIAEECCDNAKKTNRSLGGNNMLIDFQHSFGGAVGTLEDMRANDEGELIGRPYLVTGKQDESGRPPRLDDFIACAEKLKGIGRSNIKSLSEKQINDPEGFRLEAERLKKVQHLDISEEDGAYLHDIAQFYDIWFGKERE